MPDTEPTAAELRKKALQLAEIVLDTDSVPEERTAYATVLKRLASGPTLEERLMSEWHRSVTSKDTNLVRRNDRFDAAHRAMFDHARKLSEEAGG